jgi:uncharacterized protein YutE (UPF0331/DUF86 family)
MEYVSILKRSATQLSDDRWCFETTSKQSSAKHNFIVAIEAAIDLANHLMSKRALRAPEDYADVFKVLADASVIDKGFSIELGKMARFRNRLVHLYWDVDIEEVWKIIQTRLNDFEEYIRGLKNSLHF